MNKSYFIFWQLKNLLNENYVNIIGMTWIWIESIKNTDNTKLAPILNCTSTTIELCINV